jgi:hypothetical protein
MRALSEETNSVEGRRMLLKLAAEYEELAKRAEEHKPNQTPTAGLA